MKENTSRFHPRLEVLSEAQKSLWFNLQPCLKDGFVLYGGTAIALRLAHRPSVDFDFFNDKALDKSALKDSIPLLEQAEVLQDSPTWTLLIQQKEGNAAKAVRKLPQISIISKKLSIEQT